MDCVRQVHHALASMLSSILQPLVVSNTPQRGMDYRKDLLDNWFNTIADIEKDITNWALKKTKHIQVTLRSWLPALSE